LKKPVKDYGLQFHPKAGTLLICDFRGNIIPEIVKRRPVVVITPRLAHRDGLCTIVPLSSKPPRYPQPFHVQMSRDYLPGDKGPDESWAKCDLVCSVSMKRLDRVKAGPRKFIAPTISEADLAAIRTGVLASLGFPHGEI
jgi:mRNA interferase MazF